MAVNKIQDGVVVSLTYVLTVDGQEIDSADREDPLVYLHGAENIIPGLEAALLGKQVGDKLNVTLPPEDAYGNYNEDDVEVIDRDDMPMVDSLERGMEVEVEDEEGNIYSAFVSEITDEHIVLDFNPPLAGKTLTFSNVQVLDMREADELELEHGHPHEDEYDEEE